MDMEKSVGNPLRGTVIRDEARALNAQLVEWRRHLHRHPELAFDTQDTAAFVAEQLEAMGAADIKTGVGRGEAPVTAQGGAEGGGEAHLSARGGDRGRSGGHDPRRRAGGP